MIVVSASYSIHTKCWSCYRIVWSQVFYCIVKSCWQQKQLPQPSIGLSIQFHAGNYKTSSIKSKCHKNLNFKQHKPQHHSQHKYFLSNPMSGCIFRLFAGWLLHNIHTLLSDKRQSMVIAWSLYPDTTIHCLVFPQGRDIFY